MHSIAPLTKGLRSFFEVLLDLVAPPRKTEEALRRLSLDELQSLAHGEPLPYREPPVRALVWELKYRANPRALALAGALLGEELLALAGEEIGTPLLIPVPMHAQRRTARGWNQTELLCVAALTSLSGGILPQKVLGSPRPADRSSALRRARPDFSQEGSAFQYAPTVLARTRTTLPQQGLPKFVRLKNVKNSMRVTAPEVVRGRACVVVDEVTTTGTTFAECRRALKAAGAREVYCVALARS